MSLRPRIQVRRPLQRLYTCLGVLAIAALAAGCFTDPAVKKQKYFESGNRFFDQGNYSSAIIEYRNAIDLDARFGEARKKLALSYARTGNARGALDQYVRAADLLPEDVDVQIAAATLLLAARKPEDAVARADAALKVQPDNVTALVLRGNALAGLSSFDEALKSIDEAIRLDPNRGATYTSLGFLHLSQGQREPAESSFKRAVDLSPNDIGARLALGNFYWATNRRQEAEQSFLSALKIDPANYEANRFMASFVFATGRRAEAERYLRQIADSSSNPAGTLALVDYYLMTGRPKDAIARLEKLPNAQGIPGVSIRLARAHAAVGNAATARTLVEEMLKANANDAHAHLLKAQLLLLEGKEEDALAEVRAATAADPSLPDAQFALGRMYAARGDNTAAESAFREVVRLNPRAGDAQSELARLESIAGKPNDSIRTAEQAAGNDPTNIVARLTLVRSLIAAGSATQLARAARELEKLEAEYPKVAAVHVQAGALALAKNDVATARAHFEQAQTLDPKSAEPVAGLIALAFKRNDNAGAKALIEQRLKQGSTADLQLLAARTYLVLKDSVSAEKALRAAITENPFHLQAYGMLGQLHLSQERLDQALEEFEALTSRQANPVGPLTMSGVILQSQGKLDLAKKKYEAALGVDSRAAIAANNLAWILADSGEQLDRALQLAQTAIAAAPDAPELLDTLGWVYYKNNQPELAIPLFRQSIAKAADNSTYQYHLGLAQLKAGDTTNGRAALQRALDLGTSQTTATEIRRILGSS
jgi:tetratricopeptide (TPR) repeat protein